MSPDQLKANVQRFRIRPSTSATIRRRSASPDRSAATQAAQARNVSSDEAATSSPVVGAPRSVPSCDRCRTFKKKCSRTFPTCSLCAAAGEKCTLSTSVSAAHTQHLQARIEWLSGLVNKGLSLPGGKGIESIDTGTALSGLQSDACVQNQPQNLSSDNANLVASGGDVGTIEPGLRHEEYLGTSNGGLLNVEQPRRQHPPDTTSRHRQSLAVILSSESPSSDLATGTFSYIDSAGLQDTDDAAGSPNATYSLTPGNFSRQCVDAYFRHVNRAYPFIDMTKMYLDLQGIDSWEAVKTPKNPDLILLHLVMAIGCTTLQRAGKLSKGSSSVFEVGCANIVHECTYRKDKQSLQTLVLVALYSLFDPKGMCTWTIAGIASRQAILRGFSRKTPENDAGSNVEIENRHRLFWSIWVLDRMMAFSLGLPVALTDESHDVPLPGLTVEEFGSIERQYHAAMLQMNRHIIQLRQLEDVILRQVLLRKASDVAAMSQADCRFLFQSIKADIENWYSNGCLVSPFEADSIPMHSSISWLSSRYYHLLLFLHYPCPLSIKGFGASPKELLPLIQKCLQLTSVLMQQKQLPLNRVTLCRIFPVGLLLLHCICQSDANQTTLSQDSLGIIVNVLEAFPREWTEAQQAAIIFRQSRDAISLTSVMRDRFSAMQQTSELHSSPYSASWFTSAENRAPLLRSTIASLTALMREVLGNASCFIFHELPAVGPQPVQGQSGNQPMAPFAVGTTILTMPTTLGMISETSTEKNGWDIFDPAFF